MPRRDYGCVGAHSSQRPRIARRIQPVVATPRSRRCTMGRGGKQIPEAPSGARRQWAADRALRPPMRSTVRPDPSRAMQRDFWRRIVSGVTTVQAAEAVGVSWPVGSRWRDATDQPGRAHGPLSVVRRAPVTTATGVSSPGQPSAWVPFIWLTFRVTSGPTRLGGRRRRAVGSVVIPDNLHAVPRFG